MARKYQWFRNALPELYENDKITIGSYPINYTPYSWIRNPRPQDPLPPGVVFGGIIETGQDSYIGKARVGDQVTCGFFTDEDRLLHVSYGCNEHVLKDFDILVVHDQNCLTWQKGRNGYCPHAVVGPVDAAVVATDEGNFMEEMIVGRTCTPLTDGRTFDGETLQLSRFACTEQDICRPGKIHSSHQCLYVPYSGREYIFHEHEMLMCRKSPGPLMQICRYAILRSMAPYPTRESVETLPLPPKLKKFLKKIESFHV